MCKRKKLEHYLIPHRKVNSKWIKDLNVRPETIKPVEENISGKLFDISLGYFLDFFGLDIKSKGNKSKSKQMGLHQSKKNLCIAKKTINKGKRQPTEFKKISANNISYKELISKLYK